MLKAISNLQIFVFMHRQIFQNNYMQATFLNFTERGRLDYGDFDVELETDYD